MPLTRTRRRLLIATLMVVGLVGGAWWLTRRNLDPRMVGVWQLDDWTSVYHFSADGNGKLAGHLNVPNPWMPKDGIPLHWWIEDGSLCWVHGETKQVPRLVELAEELRDKLLNRPAPSVKVNRLQIVEIRADAISVRTDDDPEVFDLQRMTLQGSPAP